MARRLVRKVVHTINVVVMLGRENKCHGRGRGSGPGRRRLPRRENRFMKMNNNFGWLLYRTGKEENMHNPAAFEEFTEDSAILQELKGAGTPITSCIRRGSGFAISCEGQAGSKVDLAIAPLAEDKGQYEVREGARYHHGKIVRARAEDHGLFTLLRLTSAGYVQNHFEALAWQVAIMKPREARPDQELAQ